MQLFPDAVEHHGDIVFGRIEICGDFRDRFGMEIAAHEHLPLYCGQLFQKARDCFKQGFAVQRLLDIFRRCDAFRELIERCGPDSLTGRTAAVMLGSSETTFYVAAVYLTAAGVKNSRWAIPAALCADLACFLSAAWICRFLWG